MSVSKVFKGSLLYTVQSASQQSVQLLDNMSKGQMCVHPIVFIIQFNFIYTASLTVTFVSRHLEPDHQQRQEKLPLKIKKSWAGPGSWWRVKDIAPKQTEVNAADKPSHTDEVCLSSGHSLELLNDLTVASTNLNTYWVVSITGT